MIRSLQIKLVLSLSLLVVMLLAAAVMSMMEFRNMGDSVKGVLNNNFSSIEAAKRMMDALEREDSGLLLWIIGDREEGAQTIHSSQAIIRSALRDAEKNITETDEPRHISDITEGYDAYHASVLTILEEASPPAEAKETYDNETRLLFFRAKLAVNALLMLNQEQMYHQSEIIQERSRRAMMPAFISLVAAVLFALLLFYFIRIYFFRPIKKLTESIRDYYPEKGRLDVCTVTRDEFKQLEEEMNNLISRLLWRRDNHKE